MEPTYSPIAESRPSEKRRAPFEEERGSRHSSRAYDYYLDLCGVII